MTLDNWIWRLANIRYVSKRIIDGLELGKQVRNDMYNRYGIRPSSFLIKPSINLTRGHITGRIRKNSTDYEQLFVNREFNVTYLLEEALYFDTDLLFIDVGANVGSYSLSFGSKGFKVISIEADKNTFEILRTNISLNKLSDNIKAFNYAVSDVNGTDILYRNNGYDACNSIMKIQKDVMMHQTVMVDTITLDSLMEQYSAIPVSNVIKLDVEGAEMKVLSGATETLKHCKSIIVECHSQELYHEVRAFLSMRFKNIESFIEDSSQYVVASN